MSEEYGNDIISLMDEEGNETEYEMIDAVELNGQTYVALLPLYENPEDMPRRASLLTSTWMTRSTA